MILKSNYWFIFNAYIAPLQGLEYADCIPCKGSWIVDNTFIAITPRFTLYRIGLTC